MDTYIGVVLYVTGIILGSKFIMAVAMGFTFYFFVIVKTNREYSNIE